MKRYKIIAVLKNGSTIEEYKDLVQFAQQIEDDGLEVVSITLIEI